MPRSPLFLASIVAASLAAAPRMARADTPGEAPQQPWEHFCLERPIPDTALAAFVQETANMHGRHGWLLVSVTAVNKSLLICFARELPQPSPIVTRLPAGALGPELSGHWSDIDTREAADAILKQCFADPKWLKGKKDASLRVGTVMNKTDEHLDASVVIRIVETAIVKDGKVRVLMAPGAEMERGEGADYSLALRLASIVDWVEGRKLKTYQVSAQVFDTTTSQIACSALTEIKKSITLPGSTF